jgi:hypothetical protein
MRSQIHQNGESRSKEMKLNASARKFIARTKISHLGLFEQKNLKRISPLAKKKLDHSFVKLLNFFLNLTAQTSPSILKKGILIAQPLAAVAQSLLTNTSIYFSTPAGGKNLLQTGKSEDFARNILVSCNTSFLNSSQIKPVVNAILKLCDASLISNLQDSPALNTTTDKALACINNKYNDQCHIDDVVNSPGYVAGEIFAIAVVVLLALCCLRCICKFCCSSTSPSHDTPLLDPRNNQSDADRIIAVMHEQEKDRRNRECAEVFCGKTCTVLCC